ncbi:MAG: DUF47 family protein [Candidatus Symbiothrix sp.]|jgi:predicted phosphate transport protein (TIGR00153 family)|nr:DUF47 family protein [Candidatus Symbiothrix sp.]
MNFNSLISLLSPTDTKFLPLLKEEAGIMVKASTLLNELFICTDKERRDELCREIKVEEINGDKVSARILKELNNTFITPFDREDINAISDKMEEVTDVINRVAQKVLLYSPEQFSPCMTRMTELIQSGTQEVKGAVYELDTLKKNNTHFRHHYKEIKRLEEAADGVYEQGITALFRDETNTAELIKLKDIIQELEKTANKINSTGKVLKSIFVKYA